MRRLKRLLFLLIVLLISIGVCGCMNAEQDYKEPIYKYLKEKYGCDFVVKKTTEAFSGNDGRYIYALCESKEHIGEPFDVYCYADDGTKTGDYITLAGETYIIYEEFAEVFFRNQMKHDIKQRLSDDVFVECKIQFDCSYALHYSITEEQFKMGMETCLNDKEFYSYVTVYVVADEKTDMESLQETVESYCSKFNAHEQFLYFAISPMMEKDAIEQHYGENPQSFGKHMYDCDLIQHIECTEMNRDTGIVERTIEKR